MQERTVNNLTNIIEASLNLFKAHGINSTTSRQIADQANVALGLINHHFGSKEYLGSRILLLLNHYVTDKVNKYIKLDDDPILYDLVSVRCFQTYLDQEYHQFYLDALEQDIFFKYLSDIHPILIDKLKSIYQFEADEDTILLYSRYLPYMLEKTLILKKNEHLFQTINKADIPYLISENAMEHFIDKQLIYEKKDLSIQLATKIIDQLDQRPDKSFIINYLQNNIIS